ncbi:hypothetical protein EON63_05580 [archaeon]|nr:MAG: hypothetical protein EON63_05580 [archaeon]
MTRKSLQLWTTLNKNKLIISSSRGLPPACTLTELAPLRLGCVRLKYVELQSTGQGVGLWHRVWQELQYLRPRTLTLQLSRRHELYASNYDFQHTVENKEAFLTGKLGF